MARGIRMNVYLIYVIFFIQLAISGCGLEIATLKEYSKEQDAIKAQVENDLRRFNLLVNDIKEGKLTAGITKKKFFRLYGSPVVETSEKLLYRHPVKFSETEKVYIYFDEQERLVKWDYQN